MEEKYIKVKVKDLSDPTLKKGDFIEFDNITYKFEGYDYGTYPIVRDIESGETKQLPHY